MRHVHELGVRAAHEHSDVGPHQRRLLVACFKKCLVACLQDVSLHGIHAVGLHVRNAEESVVEELNAFDELNMVHICLYRPARPHLRLHPAIRVGVVHICVVPTSIRHFRDHVRTARDPTPPQRQVVGDRLVSRYPADRCWDLISLEVVVVDHPLVFPRHGRLQLVLCLQGQELLDPVLRPVLKLLHRRTHLPERFGHSPCPATDARMPCIQNPGEDGEHRPGGDVVVEGDVALEDDQHVRLRHKLHGLHVLVLPGLDLHHALPLSEEIHQHHPGSGQSVDPAGAVVFSELNFSFRSVASLHQIILPGDGGGGHRARH
mmetsp:Transcript_42556/g.99231  ORF Transcript_42556/g.99231 Transcript_42556/m.99231 type:complete len:318 (-) Transcript_42556:362-1315(-)